VCREKTNATRPRPRPPTSPATRSRGRRARTPAADEAREERHQPIPEDDASVGHAPGRAGGAGDRDDSPLHGAGPHVVPRVRAVLGGAAIRQLGDGWTLVTADGSLSAQWEHTVIVTRVGFELTTQL